MKTQRFPLWVVLSLLALGHITAALLSETYAGIAVVGGSALALQIRETISGTQVKDFAQYMGQLDRAYWPTFWGEVLLLTAAVVGAFTIRRRRLSRRMD